jgi:predicted metal-binding membrane protein
MSLDAARRRDVPFAVPLAIGAAWLVEIGVFLSGHADQLRHDQLLHGGPPAPLAVGAYVAGWVVMVVAMMLPSTMPLLQRFGQATTEQDEPGRAMAAFIGGYLSVWTVFGLGALVFDHGVHAVVDAWPWLGDRPWLVSAATLAIAGGYQFTRFKAQYLLTCRHPTIHLRRHQRAAAAVFDLGRANGVYCLASCWALMLVMFAMGVADLGWMVALAAVIAYEKLGRRGLGFARAAGVALLALAVVTAVRA